MSKRRSKTARVSSAAGLPNSAAATLGLWVYLIVFGGGCLALYYARIHYIPELHWKDALSELVVLSILGGCAWILFGLLLFLPAAIWSRELIWDATLRDVMCFEGDRKVREPCLAGIWKRLGMPFAVYICCAHIGLSLGTRGLTVACPVGFVLALWLYLREMRADLGYPPDLPKRWPWLLTAGRDTDADPKPAVEGAAAGDMQMEGGVEAPRAPAGQVSEVGKTAPPPQPTAGSAAAAMQRKGGAEALGAPVDQEDRGKKTAPPHSRLWKYLFWFGLSVALGSMSLLIDFALSGRQSMRDWKLALICTAVIICANLGVALRLKSHPPSAMGISVVAALALLVAGEATEDRSSLLCRTMEAFGVGEDAKVTFVVKADYRDVLCGLQIPFRQVGGPQGALVIRNVAMLSRLGINYFVRAGDRQFQLPKTEVLSWSALADSSVTLRRDDGDSDIAIQSGRIFADKVVFANPADQVTTHRRQVQLLARWEPEAEPVLVHLHPSGDQWVLHLASATASAEPRPASDRCIPCAVQTPAAAASPQGAGFRVVAEDVIQSKTATWNEQLVAWQVASTAPLEPGEYGLLNPGSGDVAAFSVRYKKPSGRYGPASLPPSPGTPSRRAPPASPSR